MRFLLPKNGRSSFAFAEVIEQGLCDADHCLEDDHDQDQVMFIQAADLKMHCDPF